MSRHIDIQVYRYIYRYRYIHVYRYATLPFHTHAHEQLRDIEELYSLCIYMNMYVCVYLDIELSICSNIYRHRYIDMCIDMQRSYFTRNTRHPHTYTTSLTYKSTLGLPTKPVSWIASSDDRLPMRLPPGARAIKRRRGALQRHHPLRALPQAVRGVGGRSWTGKRLLCARAGMYVCMYVCIYIYIYIYISIYTPT